MWGTGRVGVDGGVGDGRVGVDGPHPPQHIVEVEVRKGRPPRHRHPRGLGHVEQDPPLRSQGTRDGSGGFRVQPVLRTRPPTDVSGRVESLRLPPEAGTGLRLRHHGVLPAHQCRHLVLGLRPVAPVVSLHSDDELGLLVRLRTLRFPTTLRWTGRGDGGVAGPRPWVAPTTAPRLDRSAVAGTSSTASTPPPSRP